MKIHKNLISGGTIVASVNWITTNASFFVSEDLKRKKRNELLNQNFISKHEINEFFTHFIETIVLKVNKV